MALFNYTTKEITIKVVYYGPGLGGKTTNLQYLHIALKPDRKSKLVSLPTEIDRTLFFDLLPVEMGKVRDFSIRFQLYTVPGQVRYNATRRLVLKGADAIVFVADSQSEMKDQNIESFKNMRENLIANTIDPDKIPILLQYNKRDLTNILSIDELSKDLNANGKYGYVEAIATDGIGVEESFKKISQIAIAEIEKRQKIKLSSPGEEVRATEVKETPVGVGIGKPYEGKPAYAKPTAKPPIFKIKTLKGIGEKAPAGPDIGRAISEEPVITKPAVEQPIIESETLKDKEGKTAEEFVVGETKEEEPVTTKPIVEQPIIESETLKDKEGKTAEEFVVGETKEEEPVTTKPIVEQPIIKSETLKDKEGKTAEEFVVGETKEEEPVTTKPIVEQPIIKSETLKDKEGKTAEEFVVGETKEEEPVTTKPIVEQPIIKTEILSDKEKKTPGGFGIGGFVDEEPVTEFDSKMYEPPGIEQKGYIIPDLEEPEEDTIRKEKAVEFPPVVVEKMDVLIDTVREMLSTLKEMNNLLKDTILDQRKINVLLRDINKNFDRIKMKKRWFRFS
jgi:GTPase SAR1 family protein